MAPRPNYRPATTHADLGSAFFDPVDAARFPQRILRHRDQRWAARVGLDTLTNAEWLAHFGTFDPLPGTLPQPLALRYHGHQFRNYNPDLGDGRGFLFAQLHGLLLPLPPGEGRGGGGLRRRTRPEQHGFLMSNEGFAQWCLTPKPRPPPSWPGLSRPSMPPAMTGRGHPEAAFPPSPVRHGGQGAMRPGVAVRDGVDGRNKPGHDGGTGAQAGLWN